MAKTKRRYDPRCADCGDLIENGGGCAGAQPGEYDDLKCHIPLGAGEGRQDWPACDCGRFLCPTCREVMRHAAAIAALLRVPGLGPHNPPAPPQGTPAANTGAAQTRPEVSQVQDGPSRGSLAPDGGPWPIGCGYLEDDHLGV
ncbi:MAG: hypothetical protein JXP34_26795 [Planctomycetes bacterium]|nr:hypothetical protein [Planctomycetota bacterium]